MEKKGSALMAHTIWQEMFGSGCQIGMMLNIIKRHPEETLRAQQAEFIMSGVAGHGIVIKPVPAQQGAGIITPIIGET